MDRLSWLKPKPVELLTPSVIMVVVANLVPLYGLFSFQWQIFPILLLFWIENVLVGSSRLLNDNGSNIFIRPTKPSIFYSSIEEDKSW